MVRALENLKRLIFQLNSAITDNDLATTGELVNAAEENLSQLPNDSETRYYASLLGGNMVDLGDFTNNLEIIKRGTALIDEHVKTVPESKLFVGHLYNLGNGYSAIRKRVFADLFPKGELPQEHLKEKEYFRKAIDISRNKGLEDHERNILPDLHTNFANALNSVGRPVESLTFYNQALLFDPKKGEALINKASVLKQLAFVTSGHTHLFMLEAKRLFELALAQDPHPHLKEHIEKHLIELNDLLGTHQGLPEPEKYKQTKQTMRFHVFLREFCIKNHLYLTPANLVGTKGYEIFGDPMFITKMVAELGDDEKFAKYITLLNQIKQDYVFARYLLVQSQYSTKYAEIIDKDVDYYYPLDYSIYSSYAHMLKVSFRLAVDTLDKIAYFMRDYCEIESLGGENVSFRNVWAMKRLPLKLRPELAKRKNILLFGLLDLSLDLKDDGTYAYVYKRRNAITHRFLSLHSESIRVEEGSATKVLINKFIEETINVLQITRAAIMYLILFVDSEERKTKGIDMTMPVTSPLVEGVFRHKPSTGE